MPRRLRTGDVLRQKKSHSNSCQDFELFMAKCLQGHLKIAKSIKQQNKLNGEVKFRNILDLEIIQISIGIACVTELENYTKYYKKDRAVNVEIYLEKNFFISLDFFLEYTTV